MRKLEGRATGPLSVGRPAKINQSTTARKGAPLRKFLIAAIAGFLALSFSASHVFASDYSDGLAYFKAKDYRNAAARFEAAMRGGGANPTLIYYCALSNQLSNNHSRARQLYEYIMTSFPGSSTAALAAAGVKSLGGPVAAQGSSATVVAPGGGSTQSAQPAFLSSVPDEVRVPTISKRRNATYLEVGINGRPVVCQLDTGAFATLIGANQMEDLGLGRPNAGQSFEVTGVGSRSNIKAWQQKVDLKVGNIYIRDFPITVQDHLDGDPLLGQDFLRYFDTIVDEGSGQVTFRKKSAGVNHYAQRRGTIEIPFATAADGSHLVVDVSVNGKPYKMFFDTGADSVVFGLNDFKRLGIPLPDRPPDGMSGGVAGSTNCWREYVDLKLGPIKQENFQVSLVQSEHMGMPLLGQSFFGGYKYMVDEAKHVIRFSEN